MTGSRRHRRGALGVLVASAVLAISTTATAAPGQPSTPPPAPPSSPPSAPPPSGGGTDYIVTLRPGIPDPARAAQRQLQREAPGRLPRQVFSNLGGYTASLTPAQARALERDPGVLAVEPDGLAFTLETQTNPPWGLDRVDQRTLPLSGTYTYTATGTGVLAYVVDTGIRTTHAEFGGRASIGFDAIGGGSEDCNGHGTHVASTIGGTTYGMAKDATLIGVRVLNCNGSGNLSGIVAGLDWIAANRPAGVPAVANMSLGTSSRSTALDEASNRLKASGVTVVAAAGNSGGDACRVSPAGASGTIAVAASNRNDALASFSERGTCVNLIAPGVDVQGAWHDNDTANRNASGTSMAAPHAAGAAVKLLAISPAATPDQIQATLQQTATEGRISGTGRTCLFFIFFCTAATPNRLLYSDN